MASISSQSLRNLAAVVCLLMVISSAAALFSIHHSADNHSLSLVRFDEYKDAINSARSAQVAFKTQVQEWKNILLRGQKQQDYDIYLGRFAENERRVGAELLHLAEMLPKLGMDPKEARVLLEEHEKLGVSYRAALGNYRKGDVASVLAVDTGVRGIDRKMNEEIDGLVLKIDARGDVFLADFAKESERDEKFFHNLLLGLAIVTSLATLTFIFLALKQRSRPA